MVLWFGKAFKINRTIYTSAMIKLVRRSITHFMHHTQELKEKTLLYPPPSVLGVNVVLRLKIMYVMYDFLFYISVFKVLNPEEPFTFTSQQTFIRLLVFLVKTLQS